MVCSTNGPANADADAQFAANEILARLDDDESDVVLAALAAIPKVLGFLDAEALFVSLTALLRGDRAAKTRTTTIAVAKLLSADYVIAHPSMAEKVCAGDFAHFITIVCLSSVWSHRCAAK